MSARDENEFEVQVQCHQAGEITYVCYSPCQQGKDHSPPMNTYLLYALPLKSLPVLIYEEILGCKVNKEAIIIPSTHPFLEHPQME